MGRSLKSLTLHIGLGKTGTTVLQHFFTANTPALRARGIEYPAQGLVDHAHHLFSPHIPHYMRGRWQFEDVREWAVRVRATQAPLVLLSSELMGSANADELQRYFDVIRQFFEPRIVVYLRRQDHMLTSIYNQQVKSGRQKRPLSTILLRQIQSHNYFEKLQRWERIVGRDLMIVRPYEKDQFHGGDIRSDFLFRVFGIEIGAGTGVTGGVKTGYEFTLSHDDPNPAFPREVLEYKRNLNWVVKDRALHRQCNRVLQAYVSSQESGNREGDNATDLMSVNERLAVLGALAGSNAEVARRYNVSSKGRLFHEPLPSRSSANRRAVLSAQKASEIYRFFVANDTLAAEQIRTLVSQQGEPEGPHHRAAVDYLRQSFL